MLSSDLAKLASPPSQSRTRIFPSMATFALFLFSAIDLSPGRVRSDVSCEFVL